MGFAKNRKGGSSAPPRARPMGTFAAPPARAPAAMPRAPPPQAMPPPQQGSGLMGAFGSSMAGSMAGNMLANTMMGGRGESAPAAPPAQVAPPTAPVCTFETGQFLQCMTNTRDDLNQCQGFYDAFKPCQQSAALQ